jgi:signal transduction histidine kinase/DNA-binding response OmpR family regulator
MRICLIFILSALFVVNSFALNYEKSNDTINNIDNLKKLYLSNKINNKPDSVLHYANLLIEEYKIKNDTSKVLNYYNETCDYLINKQQYKLVPNFLTRYVEYAEKMENNKHIPSAYFQTANFFMNSKINYGIAIEYYNKSLDIYKKTEEHCMIALVYERLGFCYIYGLNKKDSALKYYMKSVEIREQREIYPALNKSYQLLALLYRDNFGDYKTSKEYYIKALQEAKIHQDSFRIADAILETGCLNFRYNKPDSILDYYFKALEIANEISDTGMLDLCYNHLSWYYNSLGDYEKSLFYLSKTKYNELLGLDNWTPRPTLQIAKLEQKLGNYKSASKYYEKYIRQNDSLQEIKRATEYSALEFKFKLEKIEKKIWLKEEKAKAAVQKQKLVRNFFILIVALLIIVVFLIYRNYKNKQISNKKLLEADRLKLRFFTNISHELRTPLTLLVSPLERMGIKLKETDKDNLVPMMLRNTKILKNQINQLLDISKIDTESLTLVKGQHDINNVFRTITSMFDSMTRDRNIDFQVSTENQSFVFSFDKERIEHVISNLLSNAFKFTPEGGKITASLSKLDNHLSLNVKDTGIGISPEDIGKVFNRFYQSNASEYGSYEGTGIGLNIVKEYIELHDGTISVKSELGKGSEFIVKLPIFEYSEELNKQSETEIIVDSDETPTNKEEKDQIKKECETLLIVEDNIDLRNYLKSIFHSKYNVIEASNGEVGKQIATKENPDIIISDVMMPVCDGYCLTEYLKSQIETCHIPIILLTAKTSPKDKLTGYKQGADDYIAKPFDENELVLKVHNVLTTRKNQKKKYSKNITANPLETVATSLDEQLLQKIVYVVEKNISNIDFNIDQFCSEVGLSRRNMFRKLKALTDMSPSHFIRTIRLKRAAQLLSQKAGSVSEIAYQTGFDNLSYFTKCFKESFQKSPSEYM